MSINTNNDKLVDQLAVCLTAISFAAVGKMEEKNRHMLLHGASCKISWVIEQLSDKQTLGEVKKKILGMSDQMSDETGLIRGSKMLEMLARIEGYYHPEQN